MAVDTTAPTPVAAPATAGRPLLAEGYFDELRRNFRPLAAASLGSSVGLMLMGYTTTIFGPYLVRTFGWSRSQFALIGLAMMATLVALPFIGRMSDRLGVRRTALIGVLGIPACQLGYSMMDGSFGVYFALACAMLVIGSFTSPMVYTRLVAADFEKARGLALTIVTISPALVGAVVAPILNYVIEHWGWRMGYRALGLFVLIGGLGAIALMKPGATATIDPEPAAKDSARTDYRLILRSRYFWIIFAAMFLCTLQTPLHATQMAMMLADRRLDAGQVAMMISVYGIGTVVGRLLCGLALDRFTHTPLVATVSMVLPALGYALLAAAPGMVGVIGLSMFLVGIAFGAEGDLQSFLVARHFDIRVFGSTLSLVFCGVFAASAIGALSLSVVLKTANSFTPFLAMVSGVVFLGSLAFLLLPGVAHGKKVGTQHEVESA